MLKYNYLYFILLPFSLFGLEVQPWFGDVYEFDFLGGYAYSRYPQVEGANPGLTSPSNDHLLFSDLEFSFSPVWSADVDIEFVETPRQSFGFRSFGMQIRYLWLDDIIGDPISLATGLSARIVSTTSLHDVSCPYHGNVDVELNVSLGKEFDNFQFWRFRVWGYGALGMSNRGSPWLRGIAAFEGNWDDQHKWGIFMVGSHGYGREQTIDVNHFFGYGRIRQKSLDLGVRYGYRFGVWGTLRVEYIRRVMAKLCPERVNTFVISYLLPFSF